MAGRTRNYQRTLATPGDPIVDFMYEVPYHSTLVQFSARWSAQSSTSEMFTVEKISGISADYNVTIFEFCPYTEQKTQILCNPKTEFAKNDKIQISYPNSDAATIGIEVVFKEAD